jgi:hypothetical protein
MHHHPVCHPGLAVHPADHSPVNYLHLAFPGTGGSVLIAGLFHAIGNITGAVLPYWTGEISRRVSFGLLLIPAVLIVILGFPGQVADDN